MRMVRLQVDGDVAPPSLAALGVDLDADLVQIDYRRPWILPVTASGDAALPEVAWSFADAVGSLARSLLLQPEVRIVTCAGWDNAYACAERAATALTAHGLADVGVAAVRGSNVLPLLDDLTAAGLRFENLESGALLRSLRAPLVGADLQFGAGPLATAIAEGARVVVVGWYDGAAPALACAVHDYGWSWQDYDRLAGAAAAARAAAWPAPHDDIWLAGLGEISANEPLRVEIADSGQFTVDMPGTPSAPDGRRLAHWLRAGDSRRAAVAQADVAWNPAPAEITRRGAAQLHVAGVTGAASGNSWRLDVRYLAGYAAETMIQFLPAASAETRRAAIDALRRHFAEVDRSATSVAIQELAAGDAEPGGWLHLAIRSRNRSPCDDFAGDIERFASTNAKMVRLATGRPTVHAECEAWPTRAPRDAVDVAVDTRPAREWA